MGVGARDTKLKVGWKVDGDRWRGVRGLKGLRSLEVSLRQQTHVLSRFEY